MPAATAPKAPTTPEADFLRFLPMARKTGHKYARRYGLPVADMVDEAESALAVIVCKMHGRGAEPLPVGVTTWVYRNLNWRMVELGRNRARHPSPAPLEHAAPTPARHNWLEQALQGLSADARTIIETITMAPAEIAEDITPRRRGRARVAVRRYLMRHGWDAARLAAAWNEVEAAI